jgi:hypothetical protein
MTGQAPRATPSAKPPTTYTSYAANSCHQPGRTRALHTTEIAARTITALLTLREKVIAPLIAGIRTPRPRPPTQELDRHRPPVRNPPPEHANRAQRPRHQDEGDGRIDNDLSIASRNPPASDRLSTQDTSGKPLAVLILDRLSTRRARPGGPLGFRFRRRRGPVFAFAMR